jgi:hypothetical protein
MGIAVFPAASAGGIKSVQRGLAASAGNVTITAVDIAKSFVTVFGTTSSGTVAASGAVSASTSTIPQTDMQGFNGDQAQCGNAGNIKSTFVTRLPAITLNNSSANLSGGSNNLVAAVVQGFLANSTTLTVSGACRYEVVEFN